jgi:hypothetical protein
MDIPLHRHLFGPGKKTTETLEVSAEVQTFGERLGGSFYGRHRSLCFGVLKRNYIRSEIHRRIQEIGEVSKE